MYAQLIGSMGASCLILLDFSSFLIGHISFFRPWPTTLTGKVSAALTRSLCDGGAAVAGSAAARP